MTRSPLFAAIAAAATALVPAAAPASGGGGSGGGDLHLVPMTEMRVPIVDGQRTTGRLLFAVVLRADDAAGAARLTGEMASLRETVLASASEFARLYASPLTPVDAGRLSREFTAALHHRDAAVSSVLLVKVSAETA